MPKKKTIANWCIENNQVTLVIYFVVMFSGISTYLTIGRNENPDIPIRIAQVKTSYSGHTALEVEQEVTDLIEERIREIPEFDEINSTSKNGLSIVEPEVDIKHLNNIDHVWRQLRDKVDDLKSSLPSVASTPIVNDEFGDVYGILLAVRGDGYNYSELKDYAEKIKDRIQLLQDVGKVELHGVQQEVVFVDYKDSRIAELSMSPFFFAQYLNSENFGGSNGDVQIGPYRSLIRTSGQFRSIDDIKKTTFQIPGRSQSIRVDDIAKVYKDYVDPPKTLTRFNGESAIYVAINLEKGGLITRMGDEVKKEVDKLNNILPWGISVDIGMLQSQYVEKSIADFMNNLAQAFIFVVLIMFVFAGIRISLVVGLLVPSATLMCFTLLPLFGVELQQISIAALIISLGLLVDNAVVVSEQILVRLGNGERRIDAVSNTVSELSASLLAASLTTICAFLPISLADSDVGAFCYSLFVVVSITLISSWILSLTIIPLFCYYFLKPLEKETYVGRSLEAFAPIYEKILSFWLKRRYSFILLMLFALGVSAWAFKFVPKLFFPPNERALFTVEFSLPYGTKIENTSETVSEFEQFLLDDLSDDIEKVSTFVGYGGPRWYLSLSPEKPNPNYAFMIVITRSSDNSEIQQTISKARKYINNNFPNVRENIRMLENGPPVGSPIQIRLAGENLESMYHLREKIVEVLSNTQGVINIHDDWGAWGAQVDMDINKSRSGRVGLTTSDISSSLASQFSGLNATVMLKDDDRIPVIVRSSSFLREDLSKLEGVTVYSTTGQYQAPLSQVADINIDWQPSNLLRRDTVRTMTIKANVINRFASSALKEVKPKLNELKHSDSWVEGFSIEYGGESEKSGEAIESITKGMPIAASLLFIVLIFQFNSILKVLIIILTIPPMLIGITSGLIISSAPFGFMAMLGMISLAGIIVNNAILLLEQVKIERETGLTLDESIVNAGKKRMRPIIMTTVTTIVGLLPLSLSGGEMWRPMANTMMFGLSIATVLTLILCPVFVKVLFRGNDK